MVLKKLPEDALTFDVNPDLVSELRAAQVESVSTPKAAPLPANDPAVIERKRKEELFAQ